MIILGSCLVAGAVIYGFVDYAHTDKKQLQRMYSDGPALPATAPAKQAGNNAQNALEAAADSAILSKLPVIIPKPKKLFLKEYSRAALDEKYLVPDTAAH